MKSSILIVGGIFGLLLIVACAPLPPQCPQLQCPACACPSTTPPKQMVFAYFIDVGQGDAILLKSGETEMLIDCGRNGEGPDVVSFLKEKNVGDLEYLMMTHPDSDHIGGCDDVLRAFKTHAVIDNSQTSDTITYKEVIAEINTEQHITATKGNAWNIGPAEIRVLQANNGLTDTNQNSIVAKLSYGTIDILFTGDCDNQCEELLLDKDINSEILKVAHHGTKFATNTPFLQKVMPQIAIVSVGTNSYGHPANEVLDRLTQEGILIYRTDNEGDIIISMDGNSYGIA